MTKVSITAEPGKQDIIMTWIFDAPRELVFKACSDPDIISKWWGPKNLTTTIDKMDVEFGGVWRFVQSNSNGNEHAFRGVFHEILPPERLVHTLEDENMPGHISLETVIFEDYDDKTKRIAQSVFQSVKDRDGMIQSGMEDKANDSYDRLAELLENMQK
jgi:uncharacterized protein YndB with AHSA1/START domain